jgi:hypothetical protein
MRNIADVIASPTADPEWNWWMARDVASRVRGMASRVVKR